MQNNLGFQGIMDRIARAPEDGGAGGEEMIVDDDIFSQDGNQDDGYEEGFEEGEEINLEEDLDPDTFWDDEDEEGESETPEQRNARLREEEKALATQLQQGIDQFNLAEDLIPEDFNPNDPQQMRQVLVKAQRVAIAQTMALVFKPVQTAIRHNNAEMRRHIAQQVQSGIGGNNFDSMLERAIPAINDKMSGPVIRQIAEQARKRYPNDPNKAIQAAKQGMRAVGLSTQSKSPGGVGRRSKRTLDSFFPNLSATPGQQARSRMKKKK